MLYDKDKLKRALTKQKLNYIYTCIKDIKNIKILELGVREGISTSMFLEICEKNNGALISVDIEDCGKLFKNPRWNFIHSSDLNFQQINEQILKNGELDVIYIDSLHKDHHVKKVLYNYYKFLKIKGYVFFDDVSWLPYAKSSKLESRVSNYNDNKKIFHKLLEIKLSNQDNFDLEFCFENSGTAKMTKKNQNELNDPKKVSKIFSITEILKTFFNTLFKKN
tara:strand:+ start:85 stop:750 length:666 start_codon:yes stop_codon:yes gene_type:complete